MGQSTLYFPPCWDTVYSVPLSLLTDTSPAPLRIALAGDTHLKCNPVRYAALNG